SFYALSKKERQLLDFLLLYPEFFSELLHNGLKEAVGRSPLIKVVNAMEKLAESGTFVTEQLLSALPSKAERQYIAAFLSQEGGHHSVDESAEHGRMFCDELLVWLQGTQRRKKGNILQQQILAAEQQGDYELVAQLQQQCLRCKKTDCF
ncbi:MAG: hypothetical protein D3904_13965, partial [Candidatus Electrothrix sp. EH2]|nr:hypothetical protein [Candidatus Electrothrix sp. EH2]